ncbi:hypothetical protein PBAL39_08255 [Pedobacter sp. BAL39]|uniref:hypothetical protein n=1 Tax=Pedobacter sp. BAL39 TaxID=391596 RepID=UPI0001559B4E|nr:hypothetical protein [Pedobacter sp. BAL39]EDM35056.1 hypothetical protein PBAL39_08255 [Pedobacter sp. BAL39]
MFLRKYKLYIIVTFLGLFCAKMMISGAPVFFAHIDKNIMNSVIMQIEVEHSADGDCGKAKVKLVEYKMIDFYYAYSFTAVLSQFGISNSFIDHFRRYVDPFHPTVPTPPPNFC